VYIFFKSILFTFIFTPPIESNFTPTLHKDLYLEGIIDIPFYYINLKNATLRSIAIEKQLTNFSYSRVEAVTDTEASQTHLKIESNVHFYHNDETDIIWKKHWEGNYTYKELATCMSHLKAIRTSYENGDELAIILEDDAVLDTKRIGENIHKLIGAAPPDWEILQLFVQHMKMLAHYNHISDPFVFWQARNWGATAYIIHRRAMKKLLEKTYVNGILRFAKPVVVADEVVYTYLNAYTSTIPYVSVSGDSSQIQNDVSMSNKEYSMQITRLMTQKHDFDFNLNRLDTSLNRSDASLCIVTRVLNMTTFTNEKKMIEQLYNGKIIWNILPPCKQFAGGRCISQLSDIDKADYVLMKSPYTSFLGFPWNTFWQKSSATISGVLYSTPNEGLIYEKFFKYKPTRDDTFFEYIVYSIGSGFNFLGLRRNRGAFMFITPTEVDVVLQRFALLNGSFAQWFFRNSKEDRFEFEWCGAAAEWSSDRTPCELIPIGIRQTLNHYPYQNLHNSSSTWVKYSENFRLKYMKQRDHKFWFQKESQPFDAFRHFSQHKEKLYPPLITMDERIMTTVTYRSPIVLKKYKWIVFTVQKIASSTQKRLIRRILGAGCSDGGVDPQNEYDACFTLLKDYHPEEATRIMQDPTWTKSIFLRDPYERVLSAYLHMKKSGYTEQYCGGAISHNFSYFLQNIVAKCDRGILPDPHFGPQYDRVTQKWWPYMNFVSTLDTFKTDFPKLLKKLSIWNKYGKQGWGIKKYFMGNQSIVVNNEKHKTSAKTKINSIYTKKTRDFVAKFYEKDILLYNNIKIQKYLPHIVIAGFQRCGTTALRHTLSTLPGVQMYDREMMYFLSDQKNISLRKWYDNIQITQSQSLSRLDGIVMGHMGSTFAGPITKLLSVQPGTKIILLLRNPVDRAFSAYQYFKDQNNSKVWGHRWENIHSFDDIIQETYKNHSNRWDIHPALRGGFYKHQLAYLFKHSLRSQVFIEISEEMWSKTYDSTKLQQFIGINETISIQKKYNAHRDKSKRMTYAQEKRLKDYYKQHNELLRIWLQNQEYKIPKWL